LCKCSLRRRRFENMTGIINTAKKLGILHDNKRLKILLEMWTTAYIQGFAQRERLEKFKEKEA
jgi:hypothetical protein